MQLCVSRHIVVVKRLTRPAICMQMQDRVIRTMENCTARNTIGQMDDMHCYSVCFSLLLIYPQQLQVCC